MMSLVGASCPTGIEELLLMIEILHDLIDQKCRNYSGNQKNNPWYILGGAGFQSSTVW